MKKLVHLVLLLSLLGILPSIVVVHEKVEAQTTATPTCQSLGLQDKDNDGYGGNAQAQNDYALQATQQPECTLSGRIIKTGDCLDLDATKERTNPVKDKDGNTVRSRDIHPGTTDLPGNQVDEDCDGADAGFAKNTNVTPQGLFDNVKNFLTWVVGGVSGIVLIIGGIMYATAVGEEEKQKKARKAMLGAVIGLIVALAANVIITIVTQNIAS